MGSSVMAMPVIQEVCGHKVYEYEMYGFARQNLGHDFYQRGYAHEFWEKGEMG